MKRLITNKNIILTGCNNGIGLEILRLLLHAGNKILCVDTGTDNLEALSCDDIIIYKEDVSSKEAVDGIFKKAEELFGKADIFFANAGFGYYEEINYESWDRVSRIFETNVFSPIYSYQKYRNHLNNRQGIFILTQSVIGLLPIPGFTLYSSTKSALSGFARAIKFEKPHNMQLTNVYPVATDTGFFRRANKIDYKKPFPVQSPVTVAKRTLAGVEKGKKNIYPSALFCISRPLMRICPPLKAIYLYFENKKFIRFKGRLNAPREKK